MDPFESDPYVEWNEENSAKENPDTDEIDYNDDSLFPSKGLIPEVDAIREKKNAAVALQNKM